MRNGEDKKVSRIKMLPIFSATVVLSAACILLLHLYLNVAPASFTDKYALPVRIITTITLVGLSVASFVFFVFGSDLFVRLIFSAVAFSTILLGAVYTYNISGFSEKVSSVEELRSYISGFGGYAVAVTVLMQILQVVVLPIPGFVAVGAAVALYGPFYGGVISYVGIWIGSATAFFIGRYLGYKFASWLVGKESLDKWLLKVKGKDKVVLTLMFLLPFFPDDVLCFVAGLSSMSKKFFFIMMTISRIVSVFTTAYSINGSIIPYDTWWGILIWAALILITGVISYFVLKHGEAIETWFKNKFTKRGENE